MEKLEIAIRQLPGKDFWAGKKVLVTGHTGFKGSWLVFLLRKLGAKVTGYSLAPAPGNSLHALLRNEDFMSDELLADIRNRDKVDEFVSLCDPEVVFHLAAQAIVIDGYKNARETYETNVVGTINLLASLEKAPSLKSVVIATTDKVYSTFDSDGPFTEGSPLGGADPYSASKAAAEMVVAGYKDSLVQGRGVGLGVARAGNVVGGGDWSPYRVFPDLARALSEKRPLTLRNPHAIRPWQHVLDALFAYLTLAESLAIDPELSGPYNFGPSLPDMRTVSEVTEIAAAAVGGFEILTASESGGFRESPRLLLDCTKARLRLGVTPRWNLETSIVRTVNWYSDFERGGNPADLCLKDVNLYLESIDSGRKGLGGDRT